MSRITGGIFSRPRGQTGGLVFGAARSREGKVVTIREKVIPSNPRTPAQVTVRNKFKSVLTTVRTLGAAVYQTAWNRAVGQLAGFQSLMSILLLQISDALEFTFTLPINLGILHFPDTISVTDGGTQDIFVQISNENGVNGTADDIIAVIAVAKTESNRTLPGGIIAQQMDARQDGEADLSGAISGATYEVYVYMLGSGTASGLKSIANPYTVTIA